MKNFSYLNKGVAAILALLMTAMLASCASKAPSLDLSDQGWTPSTVTPSESTTVEEAPDDLWADTDWTEDTYNETTAVDTEEQTTVETTEEEEQVILPEEMPEELTFIYSPNADGTTCTISTILTAPEELEIPAEIDGYTVTVLGKQAFNFSTHVRKLTLPSTLTKIRTGVFSKCTSLAEVHISDIDAWFNIEFENQASNPLSTARQLFLNGAHVNSVTVPEGLTKINAYAFYNCYSISEISLPASLADVGTSAFYNSRISRINIPSIADWMEISFENIAANPISSARVLLVDGKPTSDIVIPESITEIGRAHV